MNQQQFVFDSKTKMFTIGLMVVGLLSLLVTMFGADADMGYIRTWTSFLHNSVFFIGIAFAALFFLATHTMAWGGWYITFKRIPEAMSMFLPVGIILIVLLGIGLAMDLPGSELLYIWTNESLLNSEDKEHYDALLDHKSSFLNLTNFFLTAVVVGVWALFAFVIRKLSVEQDQKPGLREGNLFKIRFWSAIFLPVAGFSSAYAIWLWVMSIDAHWYSTLFAWYASVSMWVSFVCLMYLVILFLRAKGLLQNFTVEHMHDIGKYIFGFSVFWTYLWFSQFLLIWYANNGEETQYFYIRFEQFKPIFFINFGINFLLPFFVLMMNSSKRTLGTLGFVAGMVFLGHWIDFFQMIRPGVWYNYEHSLHHDHDHDHDHSKGGHGENTYKLGSEEAPKAVLSYYQNAPEQDGDKPTDHDDHDHDGHEHTQGDGHAHTQTAEVLYEGAAVRLHKPGAKETHGHGDEHGHGDQHHGPGFTLGIHFPGIPEIGVMLGFLGLFLFVTFTALSKASLLAANDPFLDESEHHHT